MSSLNYIAFHIRCNSSIYCTTSSDPYDNERLKSYDHMLHRTLSEIFRERRFSNGQIKELLRVPKKHTENSIFKLLLEREPALEDLLLNLRPLRFDCDKSTIATSNVHEHQHSLLWLAVLNCYHDSAELLVRSGADVNELFSESCYKPGYLTKKSTLLSTLLQMYPSAWNERLSCLIIDHGADVNVQYSSDGITVLHLAATYSRVKIAEMLLEKGADVNAADNKGITPLLEAARATKVDELLPLLMKFGADTTASDQYGRNALYNLVLAPSEHADLARVVIEKGVSPCEIAWNDEDNSSSYNDILIFWKDYQPIHLAVRKGYIKLVSRLRWRQYLRVN